MKVRAIISLLAGLGLAAACSSSSSPAPTPCNENPWECAAGQTCWPKDATGSFACLNSGPGKKGDACQNAIGSPTCGDGLACLQLQGGPTPVCAPFCDPTNPAHACASGEQCAAVVLGTSTEHVCIPAATQSDAGTDAASDTGADTASDTASDSGATTDAESDASDAADAG